MEKLKLKIKSGVLIDPRTKCWEWQRCTQSNGYGRIRFGGRTWHLHRATFTAWIGPIPKGMDVCHKCDNRKCCNPEHLFVGTRLDNMRDCKKKGRNSCGERHSKLLRGELGPGAKLTWKKVRRIRELSKLGVAKSILASKYGVSVDNIRCITRNRTWKE